MTLLLPIILQDKLFEGKLISIYFQVRQVFKIKKNFSEYLRVPQTLEYIKNSIVRKLDKFNFLHLKLQDVIVDLL